MAVQPIMQLRHGILFLILLVLGRGLIMAEPDMTFTLVDKDGKPVIHGNSGKERVITVVVYPTVAQVGANNPIDSFELVLKDGAPSETELHAIQAQAAKLTASYIESHKLNGAQVLPNKPISEQLENGDIVCLQ